MGFPEGGAGKNPSHRPLPDSRRFGQAVGRRGVPFSPPPRPPMPGTAPLYEGHPWLFGPTWSFAAETSLHAMRLIGSGLFDDCPRLQIVLGHLGEGLPFYLWRVDNVNAWMRSPRRYAARKRV